MGEIDPDNVGGEARSAAAAAGDEAVRRKGLKTADDGGGSILTAMGSTPTSAEVAAESSNLRPKAPGRGEDRMR